MVSNCINNVAFCKQAIYWVFYAVLSLSNPRNLQNSIKLTLSSWFDTSITPSVQMHIFGIHAPLTR